MMDSATASGEQMLEASCEQCDIVVGWNSDRVLVEKEADEHEEIHGHDVTIEPAD
jgi:hypothetical protein